MKLTEKVKQIDHIKTWEDIKQIFQGKVKNIPQVGKKYRSGNFGRMWKVKGKEIALKVTTDPEEIQTANKIGEGNHQGFLNIYKIVKLPPHTHKDQKVPELQLRLQEFCYPIEELKEISKRSDIYEVTGIIRGNIDEFEDRPYTVKDFEQFYQALREMEDPDPELEALANSKKLQNLYTPFLINFVDLLKRIKKDLPSADLVRDIDIHDDNIMKNTKGI